MDEVMAMRIRTLALAVINQAKEDYLRKGDGVGAYKSQKDVLFDQAKDFLNNSEELHIWCAVAGVSPSAVMRATIGDKNTKWKRFRVYRTRRS